MFNSYDQDEGLYDGVCFGTFVVSITALVRTFHHLQNYTGLGE